MMIIWKTKTYTIIIKQNNKKYADMQQFLTQACTAVTNIAALKLINSTRLLSREPLSQRMLMQ